MGLSMKFNWALQSPIETSWAGIQLSQKPENLRSLPMDQEELQPLCYTHVKLLGFDLNSLTQNSSSSSDAVSFSRNGYAVSCVEFLGIVVSRDLKPDSFLKFFVDDGTACVECILWLNHFRSPQFAALHQLDIRIIGNMAAHFAAKIRVGIVARVRGNLSSYRGVVQITVSDVVVEDDPNAEILHFLDCMRLARKCYDLLPTKPT